MQPVNTLNTVDLIYPQSASSEDCFFFLPHKMYQNSEYKQKKRYTHFNFVVPKKQQNKEKKKPKIYLKTKTLCWSIPIFNSPQFFENL